MLFTCLTLSDVLVATNCAAETGSPNGFCSTYVTSVGYQTACFCDTCSTQLSGDNTCSPLCGRGTCRTLVDVDPFLAEPTALP